MNVRNQGTQSKHGNLCETPKHVRLPGAHVGLNGYDCGRFVILKFLIIPVSMSSIKAVSVCGSSGSLQEKRENYFIRLFFFL